MRDKKHFADRSSFRQVLFSDRRTIERDSLNITWLKEEAHSNKQPKEIAEGLKADGWDISAQRVSLVKSKVKKKRKKAASAPAPEAVPALPKDAVSVGSLRKAKKLVEELGGIKPAKTAVDALAQLLD